MFVLGTLRCKVGLGEVEGTEGGEPIWPPPFSPGREGTGGTELIALGLGPLTVTPGPLGPFGTGGGGIGLFFFAAPGGVPGSGGTDPKTSQ